MAPQFSGHPLSDLHQLLAYSFMVNALQAGAIVAVMAGVVGWFMVLRRESFVGHTLSVMAFPGAGGAALIGAPLAVGYFVFCGAAAVAIAVGGVRPGRRSGAQQAALIATVQAMGLGVGYLLLSLYSGVLESAETLLFGSLLGVTSGQVKTLLAVAVAALIFLAAVGRPLLYASVDDQVARANGVPVRALSAAFLVVLGLAVAATAQITGALLVFALLVAPAAAAQQLTIRIALGLVLTVTIALAVTWIGLALSYFTNESVGFFITTLAFATYVLARAQGVIRQRMRGGAAAAI